MGKLYLYPVNTIAGQLTGSLSATVADVPVTQDGVAAINWTAQFHFDVQSQYKDFARNNDSWSWNSDVIPVSSELQATSPLLLLGRRMVR